MESQLKLFGRKILLPEGSKPDPNGGGGGGGVEIDSDRCGGGGDGEKPDEDKDKEKGLQPEEDQKSYDSKGSENDQSPTAGEELQSTNDMSESDENPKTSSGDEDSASENHTKSENETSEATNGQQKSLKKPDKILPCPRCNSMDTKFCYYNNYNVNQPRHFCKSCQRYWTAGGTMRNVPVGAGRRKNKNSASHCHHITISEALQAARIDAPNGFHHPAFKPNATVLSFGPDSPLCESMASALNIQDKRVPNGIIKGYNQIDLESSVSSKNGESSDGLSIRSSINVMNPLADGEKNGAQQPAMQNINGLPSPVPCIPGAPWPFPWNSAIPLPAIYPPGYPIPFYPAPYWNCSVPNAWNVPWISPQSPNSSQKPTNSGPNSPLGKHSRNGDLLKPNETTKEPSEAKASESPIVVPKTLRIDDPEEAAKSSIWETLGIKYDSVRREGLFKALQPKGDEKKLPVTTSPLLQANPAALSRSITFQEGA